MKIEAIDSVFLAAADLDAACRPYERLGLKLSPALDGRRTLLVGDPANLFAVHFLAATSADGPLARPVGLLGKDDRLLAGVAPAWGSPLLQQEGQRCFSPCSSRT